MTRQAPPKLDKRSARDIFKAAAGHLSSGPLKIDPQKEDPAAEALLRIFARYCELIIDRLNQAPDKNHAAFLDILNNSRIPPVAAQVPLTFTPVNRPPGVQAAIWVPARTQAAATPEAGETEPAVFETTRDVVLTNLVLKKVLALDPGTDSYADKNYLAAPELGGEGEFAFDCRQPVIHEFYLGHSADFSKPGISVLRLRFEIGDGQFPSVGRQRVDWWIPAGEVQIPLNPVRDDTAGLTRSGEVVFTELPEWPLYELVDHQTNWLGCRLRSRLSMQQVDGRNISPGMPMIGKVTTSAAWEVQEGLLEDAQLNATALDFSKDFYPFGERPRFGDVFYLKCEAFSKPLARTTIHVSLTNPASAGKGAPIPAVNTQGDPRIQWEYWNGRRWAELAYEDGTKAFTENGSIAFAVPASVSSATVNGTLGFWIRARLVAGNYGEDERFDYSRPDQGLRRIAASLAPPSIQSIAVTSALAVGPQPPEQIVTNNNFIYKRFPAGAYFQPFQLPDKPFRALYLGFNFPGGNSPSLTKPALDIYCYMRGAVERAFVRTSTERQLPELIWQYWNGSDWIEADIQDETESLSRSGLVSIRSADRIVPYPNFVFDREPCYWVRVLWTSGAFECPPKLYRILLNTVSATQATTIEKELLGSSNGLPNQTFRVARPPVLHRLELEVREPDLPSADEYHINGRSGDTKGIDVKRDRRGNVEQIWVRWQEVPDFLSSTHGDRHFLVDRQSGEIQFGDGIKGLIPPAAANNIRLHRYQTGGGVFGNKPAGSITQLRTGVPYVSAVTNLEPAFGGQNIEDWDSLRERGAVMLRHRRRAVTREDYEDLAKLASPMVAKAKCFPNLDLVHDPAGGKKLPGVVSLIVVANSPDRKPQTELHVLRQVAKYMNAHRAADTELVVLAPEYVGVLVQAVIVATGPDAGATALARCKQEIGRYLHPLTGGDHGRGWEFGRLPNESDLYAVLEAIPELEFVRSLEMRLVEARPGLLQTTQFLIFAAEPNIQLKF